VTDAAALQGRSARRAFAYCPGLRYTHTHTYTHINIDDIPEEDRFLACFARVCVTTPFLVCCFLSFMNVSVFHEMCQFLFHDSFVCVFPLFSILSRWDSESQKGDVCYDAHFRSYMSDFVFDRWFYCTCIYS